MNKVDIMMKQARKQHAGRLFKIRPVYDISHRNSVQYITQRTVTG